MQELASSTPTGPTLRDRVGKARDAAEVARGVCTGGDTKATKRRLRPVLKSLNKVKRLLASKKSAALPERDQLRADVAALGADLRALRKSLTCPVDAAR